ncbi:MAG: PAS domain-containing sensor histidine kinase, partial [Nitrosotalea sp.]
MNSFGPIGGLLLGILGLLAVAYGLDPTTPYASQAFSVGVVGAASGGIIVWSSSRKPSKNILVQQYENKSSKNDSVQELVKYKNLYEGSPVMQRTVNIDGMIIECNQMYVKNFGNEKSDIIGKSLFDHVAEHNRENMQKTFESWKKSGRVENEEIWLKRKDGSTFPALLAANNIYDNKGRLIGSNTLIRDISETYHAHKIVEDHERQKIQLDELKKMDELKEEFFMMFSKECQIPLELVKKYCNVIKDSTVEKLDSKQIEAVSEIHNNVSKLEQLIQDTIDVQKLNSNKMEFKKELFQVDEFIQQVDDVCSSMMGEKKIEFLTHSST